MYFSRTGSVFLSQILHISTWHHSGAGGRIRFLKRAKSIRIKFPKPWAHCPTMEIICCSTRPNSMPQNGSWRPLRSLKTDEHPPNEDLFFGRLLGNSFEDDHNHQHNHHRYHQPHILNIQGWSSSNFAAGETHIRLSRGSQRTVILPTRNSFRTSFGEFFRGWPLPSSQSSTLSSSWYTTSMREGIWALFMHVKPT